MPLPTFKSKDEIPEAFRSEYVQKGDEWVPNIEDVTGIKANARRVLDEKKKLEEQLEAALGGRRLDEVSDLLKKQREIEEQQARKAGDFDKLLEKRVNETKAEYEKRIEQLQGFKSKYEDKETEAAIRDGYLKAGGFPEDANHVIAITKGRRVKFDEASGRVKVYDADGDETGLTPEKFFAETFKTEAPKFYQASGGSGGGANGGGGSGGGSRKVGDGKAVNVRDNAAFLANLDGLASGKVAAVLD